MENAQSFSLSNHHQRERNSTAPYNYQTLNTIDVPLYDRAYVSSKHQQLALLGRHPQ